jgi:hypothetical protein
MPELMPLTACACLTQVYWGCLEGAPSEGAASFLQPPIFITDTNMPVGSSNAFPTSAGKRLVLKALGDVTRLYALAVHQRVLASPTVASAARVAAVPQPGGSAASGFALAVSS